MALSNTAVPIYYGEFRDAVVRGDIPVCKEISLEMNRIDALIKNPDVYYDDEAIEGWIRFCENEMTLTTGDDVYLLDTFKLWGEQLLSWFYFEKRSVYIRNEDGHGGHFEDKYIKKRLINKQYLIVGRGAAKSMYAAFMQGYFLTMDRATTDQWVVAPTMRQAEETTMPISTAITRHRGPLFQFLTSGAKQNTTISKARQRKLFSSKKGIENTLTGSLIEIRPMSIDKLQGGRNKYTTIDEWLSGDLREDVVGACEQGASKIDGWIIIAISSEGTVRNGSGDTIKMELMDILKGDYINPHVSIFHYRLDDVSEVADPSLWEKAQPNIGKTVSFETYQAEVERAEAVPSYRNEMLAKRFGIPTEGYTYFFTYDETLPHSPKEYWGMDCSLGIDLSQGDDFCAFTFMFPLYDGSYGIKAISYISELTFKKLTLAARQKYEEFLAEGSLRVMDGSVLDLDEIYEDLDEHIVKYDYNVCSVGYDPYNAKQFMDRWEQENGPFGIEKVKQGVRTESVPLGELKKLAEEKMLCFDQEIMSYTMGNCITLEDNNGNRKLYKKRYSDKIDNVAALMDAYVAYKLHKEDFE